MRFSHQGLTGSDDLGVQGATRADIRRALPASFLPTPPAAKRNGAVPTLPRFGSRLGRAFYRGVSVRES